MRLSCHHCQTIYEFAANDLPQTSYQALCQVCQKAFWVNIPSTPSQTTASPDTDADTKEALSLLSHGFQATVLHSGTFKPLENSPTIKPHTTHADLGVPAENTQQAHQKEKTKNQDIPLPTSEPKSPFLKRPRPDSAMLQYKNHTAKKTLPTSAPFGYQPTRPLKYTQKPILRSFKNLSLLKKVALSCLLILVLSSALFLQQHPSLDTWQSYFLNQPTTLLQEARLALMLDTPAGYKKALKNLEKLLEHRQNDAQILAQSALAYLLQGADLAEVGKLQEAQQMYHHSANRLQRLQKQQTQPGIADGLAAQALQQLIGTTNIDTALLILQKPTAPLGDPAWYAFAQISTAYEKNHLGEATLHQLTELLEKYPQMNRARWLKAKIYRSMGRYQEAHNELLALLKKSPQHTKGQKLLAALKKDIQQAHTTTGAQH